MLIPESVGRDLCAIFKQGNAPADQDDRDHTEFVKAFHFAKLQVTIPGQGHEDVGEYQESDGDESA